MRLFPAFPLLLILCSVQSGSQELLRKDPRVGHIVAEISPSNIRATIERLVQFQTRHTLSDTASENSGIGAARRWIKSEFDRYARETDGRMTVEMQEFTAPPSPRIPQPTNIVNVLARLRPSKPQSPERTIVICSHYDSRATDALNSTGSAPGADDDGSGVAVVLELARIMSRYDFGATILFAAFAGEEQGLFGSTHLADVAKREGWNIEGVLNNDMVGNVVGGNGTVESTYVRLFSEAYSPSDTGSKFRMQNSLGLENDGISRSLARYTEEIGRLYVPSLKTKLVYRRDRFLRGGDHAPFHERGFAAVRITEAVENFDHQHHDPAIENGKKLGDLPEFVNEAYCANIARLDAAALASLAFAPPSPTHAAVRAKDLGYNTELQWREVNSPGMAGYRIVYRETASPFWQQSVYTTDTTISIPASKDDYLFGIQSIDSAGNTSLPVIPIPAR